MMFEATIGIAFAECKLMGKFSPNLEKPSFMVNESKNVFFLSLSNLCIRIII